MPQGKIVELSEGALEEYAQVAEITAKKIRENPASFTSEGLALDRNGNGISVWSKDTQCMRDALGWLLIVAAELLVDRSSTCTKSYRASDHIGGRVVQLTGRSIIEIGDDTDGAETVADALERAAASFRQEAKDRKGRKLLRSETTPEQRSKRYWHAHARRRAMAGF